MGQEVRRKIGKYITERVIGRGAMGVVFLAKDPTIGRNVAIKCIHIPQGIDEEKVVEFRERFLREARAAGVMSHPNIVTIYEADEGSSNYPPFIAMEYIEGETWNQKIKRGEKFSPDQLFPLLKDIASALEYAHRNNVIHRDIKPGNIIQTKDNRVKLMDFGIAKVPTSELTREGQFLGTPAYMSPEQVQGKPVDKTCDIFSLGAVAYEMIGGRKPFEGEEISTVLHKIVKEDPKDLRELNPEVSKEAWAIIKKMLQKDASKRYQDAIELISDIDAYLAGSPPPYAYDFIEKSSPRQKVENVLPKRVIDKKKAIIIFSSSIFILISGISIFIFFYLRERGKYDYSVVLPEEIVNVKKIENGQSQVKEEKPYEESQKKEEANKPLEPLKEDNFVKEKKVEEKVKPKSQPPPPPPKKEIKEEKIERVEPKKQAVQRKECQLNITFDFGGTRKGEGRIEIDGGKIVRTKEIDRKIFTKGGNIWKESISLSPGRHKIKVIYRSEIMGYYGTAEEERDFSENKRVALTIKIHKLKKVPILTWSE